MDTQELIPHDTMLAPEVMLSFLPTVRMAACNTRRTVDGVKVLIIMDGTHPDIGARIHVWQGRYAPPGWWRNVIMIHKDDFEGLGGKQPCRDCDGTGVFYQISGTPCPCTRPDITVTL